MKTADPSVMDFKALDTIRVCVIDDDEFVLAAIKSLLNSVGVERVVTFANGQGALNRIENFDEGFELIFCDLNLPDIDGIALLRALHSTGFKGFVTVLSGEDHRLLMAAASFTEALGMNLAGAIQKPLTRTRLAGVLEVLAAHEPASGSERIDDAITEAHLREGLDNNQFEAFYQPKINVHKKTIAGAEALVRWRSPEHGLVSPGWFIPLAEDTGLVTELLWAMARQSFEALAAWQSTNSAMKMAVNVSVASLEDIGLPDMLLTCAKERGVVPDNIILEITESLFMTKPDQSMEVLCRLALLGFNVSIDDFGTGYSSMAKLTRFPFSELKIDRSFVHNPSHNTVASTILEVSAMLGNKLHMTVVAEGVENLEDWDAVRRVGVHLVQGYLIAKPMPRADFEQWSRNWRAQLTDC